MEDQLMEIFKRNSFSELTKKELENFKELFSTEEEFEDLKSFYVQLDAYKTNQPFGTHYMTKGNLDELFAKEHSKKGIIQRLFPSDKPFYFNPILQVAALLVVVFVIYQLNKETTIDEPQLAVLETHENKETKIKSVENKESTFKNEEAKENVKSNPIKSNKNQMKDSRKFSSVSQSTVEMDFEDELFKGEDVASYKWDEESKNSITSSSIASSNYEEWSLSRKVALDSDGILENEKPSMISDKKASNQSAKLQTALFDLLTPVY
jgi:hypothetical protein